MVGINAPLEREDKATEISTLLQRYFSAEDAQQEDSLLAALVFEHALPVIKQTTRQRLRGTPAQDRDDVESDVALHLLRRLKTLKHDSAAQSFIHDFASYSAVAAHNGCDEYMRQLWPERHRLKNRLRYLFSKDSRLSIWADVDRGLACGPVLWQARPVVTAPPDLARQITLQNRRPAAIVDEIFSATQAPVEFDALVEIFALIFDVPAAAGHSSFNETPAISNQASADSEIEQIQNIRGLWNEILQLPLNQRAALLLNLREPNGGSALWLIASLAVASVRKIAEALEFPAEQFAQLWSTLPVSDLEIAQRLNVTRQQVINLRQAARQRLARKLRPST